MLLFPVFGKRKNWRGEELRRVQEADPGRTHRVVSAQFRF
jgi:hypothetical protein